MSVCSLLEEQSEDLLRAIVRQDIRAETRPDEFFHEMCYEIQS